MTEFEKVKLDIVKFMRGTYRLDEIAGTFYDTPCLRFRQGNKTIVAIVFYDNYYDFQIIFGKSEREKFEAIKTEFPLEIQELYANTQTLHDGKWLFIRVADLTAWEAVKKLLLIKKKPNRKPLSKEKAVFGKCGHRCDICVHYTGITDEFRNMLIPHLNAVYGNNDWSMRCTGCNTAGCYCCGVDKELCEPLKCLYKRELDGCFNCKDYPCEQSTVGYRELKSKTISADAITWAILPYVPHQYEK